MTKLLLETSIIKDGMYESMLLEIKNKSWKNSLTPIFN